MSRFTLSALVLATALLAACSDPAPAPAPPSYPVAEVPLAQIAADLAGGKTTSVAVTEAYIARIKAYDAPLHAVIAIAPDAAQQAAASDARRKEGKALGPLDGIPILLKDNIDAVGMPTTAGSFALAENLPAADSELVRRLRAAGAVILGKANTSQWAGFRTEVTFHGSTVGGAPHNPYDLTRNTGGSSSGSGVAAAVSFAAATVGSDTSGSVTSPASYNGVVGLRPTTGLISRRGIVPISLTQDTSGPMARDVRDTAMLLNVLAGSDAGDPWSKDSDARKSDYVAALKPDALKGKRLGVLQKLKGHSENTEPLFQAALKVMEGLGAELVLIPEGALEDMSQEQLMILNYDFKEDIASYLTNAPPAVKTRTLADLIAFNKADARENMHPDDIFESSEATVGGRADPAYIRNRDEAQRKTGPDGIDRLLREHDVVALIAPTQPIALKLTPEGTPDPRAGGGSPVGKRPKGAAMPSLTTYSSIAGYPMLSVPMGLSEGMPVGLSFVGTKWSEAHLLALGYAYEQASKARIAPKVPAQ